MKENIRVGLIALLLIPLLMGCSNRDEEERENHAPVANAQDIRVGKSVTTTLTLTGSDEDGDTLRFEITENPQHGTLAGTAPDVRYTPDDEYLGSDGFKFKVSDGEAESEAEVTIAVIECLTMPLSPSTYHPPCEEEGVNHQPIADTQSIRVAEGHTQFITLHATDRDEDELIYTIVDAPTHGALDLSNLANYARSGFAYPTVIYTPNSGYVGLDSFTFQASDGALVSGIGTVHITVESCSGDSVEGGLCDEDNGDSDSGVADASSLKWNEDNWNEKTWE